MPDGSNFQDVSAAKTCAGTEFCSGKFSAPGVPPIWSLKDQFPAGPLAVS